MNSISRFLLVLLLAIPPSITKKSLISSLNSYEFKCSGKCFSCEEQGCTQCYRTHIYNYQCTKEKAIDDPCIVYAWENGQEKCKRCMTGYSLLSYLETCVQFSGSYELKEKCQLPLTNNWSNWCLACKGGYPTNGMTECTDFNRYTQIENCEYATFSYKLNKVICTQCKFGMTLDLGTGECYNWKIEGCSLSNLKEGKNCLKCFYEVNGVEAYYQHESYGNCTKKENRI